MKTPSRVLLAFAVASYVALAAEVGARWWPFRPALGPIPPPAGVVARSTGYKPLGLRVVSDADLIDRLRAVRSGLRALPAAGEYADPKAEAVRLAWLDGQVRDLIADLQLREGTIEALDGGKGVEP